VEVEAMSRSARKKFQDVGIPVYLSVERALRGIYHALTSKKFQCH